MKFESTDEMVPYLTTSQMVEVDRAMIEDLKIGLIQMMENAGRNLAHLVRARFLAGDPVGRRVVVLAGTGGNGGGALVAARRLHNWGASVRVYLTQPDADFSPVAGHQLDAVRRMGLFIGLAEQISEEETPDVVLDGLIGYSLLGAPRGTVAELIRWANTQSAPVVALDSPSGIDTTTGVVFDPAIRATATMTLALPKSGFLAEGVAAQMGELYLADIGVPPGLYAKPGLGLAVGPLFARDDVIRLR